METSKAARNSINAKLPPSKLRA